MKRRSFILVSLFSLCGVGVLSFVKWIRYLDRASVFARPKFLSLLCDKDTIRMLGRAYLELKPQETGKGVLLRDLLAGKSRAVFMENQDMATAEIEKRIRQDFDTDNIILVQGWVLSITEARQCAYFSTLNE